MINGRYAFRSKEASMPKNQCQQGQGQKRKISIKWVVKDRLQPGFGHGIEFWYSKGDNRNEDTDILVAILEGYRWFHNPLQKWITVKILPKDSPLFKRSKVPADEIIRAIRFGAKKFFETKTKGTKVTEEVKVWWNT
jgi:hypothetical protein